MKLFIGFGFSGEPHLQDMIALIEHALRISDFEKRPIAALATIDRRKGHALPAALSRALDVPIHYFAPSRLELETPRLKNPSEELFAKIGCHSVAEAAALAAAGQEAELVMGKLKSGSVTLALAFVAEA